MISFSLVALRTLAITAPTERLCDKNEEGVSFFAYLRHTNRYGWHISLKRKFTQISRHLFETHIAPLVTVKVVVAVRQHAKQTRS